MAPAVSLPFELTDPEGFDDWVRARLTDSVLPSPGLGDNPDEIRSLVSVHFPSGDLAAIEAALRDAPNESNDGGSNDG